MQLLFQKPTQVLPIVCLVSQDNGTGKTMFAKFVNEIFKGNGIIIGKAEISSDFNAYLLGKLVVAIDESFLDKKLVIEKIKSLATATTSALTKKGKDTIEVDFFGKIILLSNNVDNFITATDFDIRYWVLTVPKVEEDDPGLFEKIKKEIPAFLYFLQKRTMFSKNEGRAWFKPDLIRTNSLQRVIDKSKPSALREIETHLIDMFETFQVKEIQMSLKDIKEVVFNNRMNISYLKELCVDFLKLKTEAGRYKYPSFIDDNNQINIKKGNNSHYTFTPEMFKIDSSNFKTIEEIMPFKKLLTL